MIRTAILPIAALAALLPAQTGSRLQAALATADASGVHANRQIDAVRAGTTVMRPLVLHANDGRDASSDSIARHDMFQLPGGAAPGAAFEWRAYAGDGSVSGTLGGSPLSAGAQSYELVLTAPQPITGRILVLFDGTTRGVASARASVAVGQTSKGFVADGSPHRDSIDGLTIGLRPLRVDIQVAGHAAGSARSAAGYAASLQVAFVADNAPSCQVLPGVASCAEGGVLRGAVQTNRGRGDLQLALSGALPDAIGVTIVSPDGQTFPIRPTGCVFFQTAIIHGSLRTDANGDARTSVPFPLRVGGAFFVQQATLLVSPRGLRLGTSNTLEVRCN